MGRCLHACVAPAIKLLFNLSLSIWFGVTFSAQYEQCPTVKSYTQHRCQFDSLTPKCRADTIRKNKCTDAERKRQEFPGQRCL